MATDSTDPGTGYDSDAAMEAMHADYGDWYETERKELTRLGIKAAFRDRGKHCHNGRVGFLYGWFLFAKLMICVWFDWDKPSPHYQRDECLIGLIHHTP